MSEGGRLGLFPSAWEGSNLPASIEHWPRVSRLNKQERKRSHVNAVAGEEGTLSSAHNMVITRESSKQLTETEARLMGS